MVALVACLLIAVSAGGYIFYNTNVLNKIVSPKQGEKEAVIYENKYKRFEKIPQPRIVASAIKVDIFPDKRSFDAKGTYVLKNKQALPIDTVYINYIGDDKKFTYHKMELNMPHTVLLQDKKYGVKMMKLKQSLMPGDSLTFSFTLGFAPHSFENGSTETSIVENGTFFNNGYFPSIGYNANGELGSNAARKNTDCCQSHAWRR